MPARRLSSMIDPTTLSAEHQELFARYDQEALQTVVGKLGVHFLGRLGDLDAVDPQWAANFLQFIAAVHGREVLDPKTRALVAVGQVTVMGNEAGLGVHANDALNQGASEQEVTEVILQSAVLCGFPTAHRALGALRRIQDARAGGTPGA